MNRHQLIGSNTIVAGIVVFVFLSTTSTRITRLLIFFVATIIATHVRRGAGSHAKISHVVAFLPAIGTSILKATFGKFFRWPVLNKILEVGESYHTYNFEDLRDGLNWLVIPSDMVIHAGLVHDGLNTSLPCNK
jgi:hypothetical protein